MSVPYREAMPFVGLSTVGYTPSAHFGTWLRGRGWDWQTLLRNQPAERFASRIADEDCPFH